MLTLISRPTPTIIDTIDEPPFDFDAMMTRFDALWADEEVVRKYLAV